MRSLAQILLSLAVLAGCQSAFIRPIEQMPDRAQLDDTERGVWRDAEDFDRQIARSEAIYIDDDVTRYVQGVMDRLYPEFKGRIPVRILRAPTLNAFALPNGSIYIHLGMLARLDNEAQLATVLAHEGVHFTHRHTLKQRGTVKTTAAVIQIAAVVPLAALVGVTVATSAIYGYSRDLEREADAMGYKRLVRAGYDPAEAPKTFEHLAAEVKALDEKEPLFFASHPRLLERIESFRQLNGGRPVGGRVHTGEFLAATRAVRLAALEADLARQRYQAILLALENGAVHREYPPEAHYYLGEAYRQRGQEGDETRARDAYLTAVKNAPRFAPSYRALGIQYMKQNDRPNARSYLKRYLDLAPNAPDRAYIAQYHADLQKDSPQ